MNEPASKTPIHHLTIGEFSRRSRLSFKALRLYDAMGLLPRPTWMESRATATTAKTSSSGPS
ncbi:MAG: MerR family DNA-binding transcriptional regulator [Deinococcota bacterium]